MRSVVSHRGIEAMRAEQWPRMRLQIGKKRQEILLGEPLPGGIRGGHVFFIGGGERLIDHTHDDGPLPLPVDTCPTGHCSPDATPVFFGRR